MTRLQIQSNQRRSRTGRSGRTTRRMALTTLLGVIATCLTALMGATPADATVNRPFVWPISNTASSSTSAYVQCCRVHPITGVVTPHRGRDMPSGTGSAVIGAAREGTVTTVCSYCGDAGNYIAIDHGHGYVTQYMHLSQMWVAATNVVTRDQSIGVEGATGGVTGAHLHFEINLNGNPAGTSIYEWDDAFHYTNTWARGAKINKAFNPLRTHDSIGVYRGGTWYLNNSFAGHGTGDYVFGYGDAARIAVPGDFNGDGIDTAGIFANWTPVYSLRDSNTSGAPNYEFAQGDTRCRPFVGDWDGNGTATPGFYCPEGIWYLNNVNYSTGGSWAYAFAHGGVAGDRPVVGDFDGNGTTDVAIVRDASSGGNLWYINLTLTNGYTWGPWYFGSPGDLPVSGDWDGDGYDSIGVWRPSTATWYLKNVSCCNAYVWDYQFAYGISTDQPVTGDWDGW